MNYFALQSDFYPFGHLCIDQECRDLDEAVRRDILMTFSSKRAAQEYADQHGYIALNPVDLREIDQPERIEGIENYLTI